MHCRDSIESGKQKGKGIAQDLLLISSDWGFELSDVQDVYKGSIHIFQGDQDNLVPLGLQQCIKNLVSALHQCLTSLIYLFAFVNKRRSLEENCADLAKSLCHFFCHHAKPKWI